MQLIVINFGVFVFFPQLNLKGVVINWHVTVCRFCSFHFMSQSNLSMFMNCTEMLFVMGVVSAFEVNEDLYGVCCRCRGSFSVVDLPTQTVKSLANCFEHFFDVGFFFFLIIYLYIIYNYNIYIYYFCACGNIVFSPDKLTESHE